MASGKFVSAQPNLISSDFGRFSVGEPQAGAGSEQKAIENGQDEREYSYRVLGPVLPIKVFIWTFIISCVAGCCLMLLLARWQDRSLP